MKFLRRPIIILTTFFSTGDSEVFAQETPIQLDRPDQTECPFIVPRGYIQLESGFTFEKPGGKDYNLLSPTILWKYGLHDRFEFRLITEMQSSRIAGKTQSGINPLTLGFKTNICRERGILPTISFIGHITTSNLGSRKYHTTYMAPSFRFTLQHTLSEKISLGYNLGAEWDGESAAQTYIYTLTTGISLTKRLGCYLELYGFSPQGEKTDHRFDGGLTYLVNNDLMLDISGGKAITDLSDAGYLALGISYRFRAIK